MRNLILALNRANLSPDGIGTILTEFEVWVDSKVLRSNEKLMIETITPLQRENDGIRSEVRILAETMKQGFALMDERFQHMEQKLDFTRKHLELQIASTRDSLEKQIATTRQNLEMQITSTRDSLEKQIVNTRQNLEMQIASTRENLEMQIGSTRENLETQIKANDKQLALVQKLLWLVLTLVLGLFAKAIHLF
jgi:dGTP triphosphohydrolase